MIDLEKYGFKLKNDFGYSVIYELENTPLGVSSNGEHYCFYSIIENARVDYVYMIKLHSEKDFVFILNNVRDVNFWYDVYLSEKHLDLNTPITVL